MPRRNGLGTAAVTVDVFVAGILEHPPPTGAVPAAPWVPERCFVLHKVELRARYVTGDGRHALWHFQAPDAESVRQLLRRAGWPYHQLWC